MGKEQKILEELIGSKPEQLTGEAKRLFEAIMKIADERDEFEYKYNRAIEDLVKLEKERQADKEKIKELEEEIDDMKALFEIQASIAKELDFDTDKKMTRFKDTYYVPDTMEITADIGEPKRIALSYIEATKYLDRYLVKDGGE